MSKSNSGGGGGDGGGSGPRRTAQASSQSRSGSDASVPPRPPDSKREKSVAAAAAATVGDEKDRVAQEDRNDAENESEGDEDDTDGGESEGLYAMSHEELTDLAIRHMGWTKSMCVRELPYSLARALESVGIDRNGLEEHGAASPSPPPPPPPRTTSKVSQRVASRSASSTGSGGGGGAGAGGGDRKHDTMKTRSSALAGTEASSASRSSDETLASSANDAKSVAATATARHHKTRVDERLPSEGEKRGRLPTPGIRTHPDAAEIARKRAHQASDLPEPHANGRNNKTPSPTLRATTSPDASENKNKTRGPSDRADSECEQKAHAATAKRGRDTRRPASAAPTAATDYVTDGDSGERKEQAPSSSSSSSSSSAATERRAKTNGSKSSPEPLAVTRRDPSDARHAEFAAAFVVGADALSRAAHHRAQHRREASSWLLQLRYVWLTMNSAALHEAHLTAVLALVDDWRRTHRDCVPQWHEAARTAAERLYAQTHDLALIPWLVVETRRLEPLVHLLAQARLARVLSHDRETEALDDLCRRAQRTIDAYDQDAGKQSTSLSSSSSSSASAPPLTRAPP